MLSDAVLFSAAVPFQYGTNHVNEQWPEYWSILFRGQGFECFDPLRAELWNDPDVDWWYAQNALLYARTGTVAAAALPAGSRVGWRGLSLVHPESLLANLLGLPRRFRQQASQEETRTYTALSLRTGAGTLCCQNWQDPPARQRRGRRRATYFPAPGRRSSAGAGNRRSFAPARRGRQLVASGPAGLRSRTGGAPCHHG